MEFTGWKQSFTLAEGLSETINWFKNPVNLDKYKADIYNI